LNHEMAFLFKKHFCCVHAGILLGLRLNLANNKHLQLLRGDFFEIQIERKVRSTKQYYLINILDG